jgi:hypothetical protein
MTAPAQTGGSNRELKDLLRPTGNIHPRLFPVLFGAIQLFGVMTVRKRSTRK